MLSPVDDHSPAFGTVIPQTIPPGKVMPSMLTSESGMALWSQLSVMTIKVGWILATSTSSRINFFSRGVILVYKMVMSTVSSAACWRFPAS